MPDANRTYKRNIHDEIAAIARQNAYVRDIIAQSCKLLQEAMPDTFLGRKTYEPFPGPPSSGPDAGR